MFVIEVTYDSEVTHHIEVTPSTMRSPMIVLTQHNEVTYDGVSPV